MLANPESATAFRNLRELASQQFAESYAKAIGKTPPKKEPTLNSNGLDPIAMKKAIDEGRTVLAAAESCSQGRNWQGLSLQGQEAAKAEAARLAACDAQRRRRREAPDGLGAGLVPKRFQCLLELLQRILQHSRPQDTRSMAGLQKSRASLARRRSSLEVSDISVTPDLQKKVEVRYNQRYESGSLRVRSRKNTGFGLMGGRCVENSDQSKN